MAIRHLNLNDVATHLREADLHHWIYDMEMRAFHQTRALGCWALASGGQNHSCLSVIYLPQQGETYPLMKEDEGKRGKRGEQRQSMEQRRIDLGGGLVRGGSRGRRSLAEGQDQGSIERGREDNLGGGQGLSGLILV